MTWRLISEDGVGAAAGLAGDEVLVRGAAARTSPPTLRLYTYRPHAALVGRFQDVANEVHVDACRRAGIELGRRPTGGGAILMGPDQLGVALAVPRGALQGRARDLMVRFSEGLRLGLAGLGIEAPFRGKNDLEVGGRKIAGLGIHRDASGGLLFHASLLLDLDVELMSRVLRTPFVAITERELEIVAGRTTTVRALAGDLGLDEVRERVAAGYAGSLGVELAAGELDDAERAAVDALERDKYASESWIFQRTDVPDSAGRAELETIGGRLDVRIALAGRTIKALHLRGDFFESEGAVADLESRMRWHPSDPEAVSATVEDWARNRSDGMLAPEALARAIVAAAACEPYGCFVTPEGSRA